ncbi:MAG: hypothetical protein F4Y00_04715 [Bacteroidetes bacterium SB0662_bin_6]|nr:hypothetical protein [Bacteroidetes bacterium SB0668_bin_1]MYE04257.1 hypothetical protein [Bacteroidetes bacterium SB0662_bin_6]
MSASASRTRSLTAVNTYTDVVSVTRKLRADLLQVLDHYGYFSEDHAEDIIHDLRLMVDEGILESVELTWRAYGSHSVLAAFRYYVINGSIAPADNRPGGIPYRPDLQNARFNVVVRYNAAGRRLSPIDERNLGFKLPWVYDNGFDYLTGSWSSDRYYVSNSIGLQRLAFNRASS